MERGGWFKGQDFHDQNEEEGKDDLLPAGEQLGPHQLSVKLLFRRLEGTRLPSIIIVTTTIKKKPAQNSKGLFPVTMLHIMQHFANGSVVDYDSKWQS